jgi:hypothetical protein
MSGRCYPRSIPDTAEQLGREWAKRVLAMRRDGLSYRLIGRNLGLFKNTVMEIIRRAAA